MDTMQRIAILLLFLCVVQANAIYLSASLGDSRLQEDNQIYKPGGIFHVSLETGFFNEPENEFDYKLAFGIDRFGYSHSDGEVSVSFWEAYFKPVILSTTKRNIMFEYAPYVGLMIDANNLSTYSDSLFFDRTESYRYRITLGYEYRLGYQLNEAFFIGITANYHVIIYGIHRNHLPRGKEHYGDDSSIMGGWGLNFQYNLPW